MSQIRFIKTKIDKIPRSLQLTSCNLCPLLLFDKDEKTVKCSRFFNNTIVGKHSNIICSSVHSFSMFGKVSMPLLNIDIPWWCSLPRGLTLMFNESKLYVKNGNNSYEVIPHNEELTMAPSLYVEYDRKMIDLIFKKSKNSNLLALQERYDTHNYNNHNVIPYTPPIVLKKCSCCGKEKKDIDRSKNIGMCDDCWKIYEHDENKKKQVFINNFRLKRNKDFPKESLKLIE